MVMPNGLGAEIRGLRARRKLTQSDLASAAGFARMSLNRIEGGKMCSAPVLCKLLVALEATPEEVVRVVRVVAETA